MPIDKLKFSETTARARNRKTIDITPTKELIKKSKSATEWFKHVIYDKEAVPSYEYKPVRVRYSVNTTRELHIEDLRIALFNYLFAKKNNGAFILRISDIYKNHEIDDINENIIKMLKWTGLTWDEGVDSKYVHLENSNSTGPCAPYLQSERLSIYNKWIHTLLENHQAYHCFWTQDRLHGLHKKSKESKGKVLAYDRAWLSLSEKQIKENLKLGVPYSIRMYVPDGETTFQDSIHGKMTFSNNQIDDQILINSNGYPTHYFADVVDDYNMGISHVIREAEYLPSISKSAILYKMFDIDSPSYAHIPALIHNKGGKIIHDNSFSVRSFKDRGYMPEALVNGLAIAGWTPPSHEDAQSIGGSIREFMESEVLDMEDLEAYFNILKIGKNSSKFEEEKVKYFNSQHIKRKFIYYNMNERRESTGRFRELLFKNLPEELHPNIRKYSYFKLARIMDIVIPRIQFYSDLNKHWYFFEDPDFSTAAAQADWKRTLRDPDQAKKVLNDLYDDLNKLDENFLKDDVHKLCSSYIYEQTLKGVHLKNEDVFILLRFAITASRLGGEVGDVWEIIGKSITLKRISDFTLAITSKD